MEGKFCFPRYCNQQTCNSNSASAALNKWIKTLVDSNATIHGLRRSFRDILRQVEAPLEIIDQLSGWSLKSVGQAYGEGYSIDIEYKWSKKISMG